MNKVPTICLALVQLSWLIVRNPRKTAMAINHIEGKMMPRPVQITKESKGDLMELGNVLAQKVVAIIGIHNKPAKLTHIIAELSFMVAIGRSFSVCWFIPYLYSVFDQEESINIYNSLVKLARFLLAEFAQHYYGFAKV
tara:strand:- start:105 stop:521 length:417 start_codon:yes stop_codon:yes gene_type:complete